MTAPGRMEQQLAAAIADFKSESDMRFAALGALISSIPDQPLPYVHDLVVAPASLALDVAETGQLVVTARDQYGDPIEVTGFTYVSSVPGKATVNGTGLVTGVAGGSTIVTVTHTETQLTAACAVTVISPIVPVDHVNLTPASAGLVAGGGTVDLTADPEDSSNNDVLGRVVTWASDNPAVATVASLGGYLARVTPVAAGTAHITATCEGINSPPCTITVSSSSGNVDFPTEPAGNILARDTSYGISRPAPGFSLYNNELTGFGTGSPPAGTAGINRKQQIAEVWPDGLSTQLKRLHHWINTPGGVGYEHQTIVFPSSWFDVFIAIFFRLSANYTGAPGSNNIPSGGVQKLGHLWLLVNGVTGTRVVPAVFGSGSSFQSQIRVQGISANNALGSTFNLHGINVPRNKIMCLALRCRVNTPGVSDGILQLDQLGFTGGVPDGPFQRVIDNQTIRFTDTGAKRIEKFQDNPTCFGSNWISPVDQFVAWGRFYASGKAV